MSELKYLAAPSVAENTYHLATCRDLSADRVGKDTEIQDPRKLCRWQLWLEASQFKSDQFVPHSASHI